MALDKELKFYTNGAGDLLSADKSFVYKVEIYKLTPRSYNLEDSKTLASKDYTKPYTEYFLKEGVEYRKTVELRAAPKKWLDDNGYR